jgi:hypothetical protein
MRWFFDLVTAIFRRRRQRRMDLLRYWDGAGWRYGDPFLLYRALWNHPELNIEAQAPLVDAGQEPETTVFVTALAEIFGVQRWDPATRRGLTDWEVLDCFQQLNEYMVALKKNISGSQTSLPPTGSESSTGTEAAESSAVDGAVEDSPPFPPGATNS